MEENTVLIQRSGKSWFLFKNPVGVIQSSNPEDVLPKFSEVETALARGLYAAGFLSYEAASGFDRALSVHPSSNIPVLWFGLYDHFEETEKPPAPTVGDDYMLGEWQPNVSESDYLKSIERIKSYIHAGDTYQVNYTTKLRAPFRGDPYSFFHSLSGAQQGRNCAYINLENVAVCSASPELFFSLKGNAAKSCPMKGTAPRGLSYEDDCSAVERLRLSEKDKSENIMIVDMIRNDLGRVAVPGSVQVSSMFDIERYPTVLQMTSTVRAETTGSISEILKAMFPCASITGAPKVRAMEIIKELEQEPRGIYTGSIGCIAPGPLRKALFNVAIRTVVIDKKAGKAEYGVGGGIVWDSDGHSEYAECLTKARVLTERSPKFELLETMLWTAEKGYYLMEEHITRIMRSAEYFLIPVAKDMLVERLVESGDKMQFDRAKVRLLIDQTGQVDIQSMAYNHEVDKVYILRLAERAVNSKDKFLYHKTTNRAVYKEARGSCTNCDDVILYNERGEITETTIANIVVRLDGELYTPSLKSGILPGTLRSELLKKGEISERVITTDDLGKCEEIFMVNSLRGWMRAVLVD